MVTKITRLTDELNRLILHPQRQKWAKAVQAGGEIKYPHQSQPLTPDILDKHLSGALTVGVMLVNTNITKAGCLDIDCPRDARNLREGLQIARRIQKIAAERNLKTYSEFSGNRGWHVWLFSAQPVTGNVMIAALDRLAKLADFQAKEIFPNHPITESKCIKLPYAVHLKSSRRSGFIGEHIDWDEKDYPVLPDQAELMTGFIQNEPEAILALTESPVRDDNLSEGREQTKKNFKSFNGHFPRGEHPSCINHLIANGIPLELDYNQGNLTLVRYCLDRQLDENEAIALAKSAAAATTESHPTSKDFNGKVSNFKSAFKSAKRKREDYRWDCSYVLSGIQIKDKKALFCRGCIGEKCPMWQYGKDLPTASPKPEGKLIHRAIWQAIYYLASEGLEIRLSTLLQAIEGLEIPEANEAVTAADALIEAEVLAYILQHPETAAEVIAIEIPAVAFRSACQESPQTALESLLRVDPLHPDTFSRHLEHLREIGLRTQARETAAETIDKVKDRASPLAETLDKAITAHQKLLRQTSSEIQPMVAYTAALLEDLFSFEKSAIATPSQWLNNVLNGGLGLGKLYVLGAPPGAGKTTFTQWLGDYAAANGYPVLVASYEMGKAQLWQYALARLAGIDSALIERRSWRDPNHPAPEMLAKRVSDAALAYQETIAPNLTILECSAEHTAARLKGAIAQIRHRSGLDDSDPLLVIIDYLQLMLSGDEKLDTAAETLRVSRIATSLKQLARDTNTAVIAISDITKAAYQQALSTGSLDMSALRDSFKIAHAADVIALLQSGKITIGKGDNVQTLDQLELAARNHPEKRRAIDKARAESRLGNQDSFARLSILKNRGGMTAEPLFIYHKAQHNFEPMNLELGETNYDEI